MVFGLTSTVWASEMVTIQVINAVYEKSITHAFDAKLKKTGLKVNKKIENGHYIVTVGTFKDEKSAQSALKKARMVVTKDAFIRLVERHTTAVAHTDTHPAMTHVAASEPAVTPVVIVTPTVVVAPAVQAVQSTSPAVPSACDKKEARKDDFAEAIQFYKTSPYYRFEPVVLRQ